MPKREDIKSVLIIGSGPIIIGQASEFDYSGSQAVKSLKEEGIRVILINSNPATIMTDPDMADAVYIEPLTVNFVAKVIEKEKPDALLPTLGGQTGLNLAVALYERGILEKYNVELIGASIDAIKKAEDRELFIEAMNRIGLKVPESGYAGSVDEAFEIARKLGFPVVIRPSFTLGGTGGNIATSEEEFKSLVELALRMSPVNKVLIEKSVAGWKEYELEVMRDKNDNVVIVCSIENVDPMGVHTGDSITVAPQQTLTDKEYQRMRDAAISIIREIGVDTGGSNIQFAVNPEDGEMYVIEMNPRVSRSSALASKATGFPIAKIAAKLAIGYTLDELPNDITRETPASFEPALDYVVVKIPRFAFEKFPEVDPILTTQMKSVGEVMAIGRNFREALLKAISSLEINASGLKSIVQPLINKGYFGDNIQDGVRDYIEKKLKNPNSERIFAIGDAFRFGLDVEKVHELTGIDPFFLYQIREIVELENSIRGAGIGGLTPELVKKAKEWGFSDKLLAELTETSEDFIRKLRKKFGIKPVFKVVDTCAAEFEAYTPYFYSTYEEEDEEPSLLIKTGVKSVIVLGSGPNRIGQGIEFDYACVHSIMAIKEEGLKGIMINSNPETVSTDYDTSDRLYFEPVSFEYVMNIIEKEDPAGIIVQFGGQSPLNMARKLAKYGVRILGTEFDSIDRAEDRERFKDFLDKLGLKRPRSGIARTPVEALEVADFIGYPVLVRPSYVLGGRAMGIIHDRKELKFYLENETIGWPLLVDEFLLDAYEVDVDAVSDGSDVYIGGILEHVHEAGIHSGDSAMILPPFMLPDGVIERIRDITVEIAKELAIKGIMNVQYAVREGEVYVIEVNPRASRTVPFISKATGVPLAKIATKVMLGRKLKEFGLSSKNHGFYAVKEAVFSFNKFPGVDPILGPEMRSTGEVMGVGRTPAEAFYKSQVAAGFELPSKGGKVFLSVKDSAKPRILDIAEMLVKAGLEIIATEGTAKYLKKHGIKVESVGKLSEGSEGIVGRMKTGEVVMVINIPAGKTAYLDSVKIRRAAFLYNIPGYTSINAARFAVRSIVEGIHPLVYSLKEVSG